MGLRIAIVGATGLVGARLLSLAGREPEIEVGCFASASSAGKTVTCGERSITVQALADCDFAAYDAALFAIGDELSAEYVPRALVAGCAVVDKSNAFRLTPDVPLVVAGVNDAAVTAQSRLVANPNCSTIILAHALAPLEQGFGVRRVFAATYQSVSGAGAAGVARLAEELTAGPPPARVAEGAPVDAEGYAGNVIPQIGGLDELGRCGEEAKLVEETRKILGRPDLPVVAHSARVPVVVGHSIAVTVELDHAADEAAIRGAWQSSAYLTVMGGGLPTPAGSARHDNVEVGRLRRESGVENGWSFFISGDNVNIGAGLNGWRILQLLRLNGVVREQALV